MFHFILVIKEEQNDKFLELHFLPLLRIGVLCFSGQGNRIGPVRVSVFVSVSVLLQLNVSGDTHTDRTDSIRSTAGAGSNDTGGA